MKSPILTIALLCLFFLASCISRNKTSLERFNQDIYTPEYASGFKILGADNAASTLIQVSNPWQGAQDVKMSYFISRNGEQAPAGFNGPVIPAGARNIVCMSSSYIAMLDALGELKRIVGVSGINYVSNPYILAHKDSIKDMGAEMNYELLLGLKPDVVLLYGIGDAQTAVTDKLKELAIPYIYMGEYLEESPLGKAEWMVVLSELIDNREKGVEVFREIPKRYHALKALTDSISQHPTVMFNHSMERQLGNAFHPKLHGTVNRRRGCRLHLQREQFQQFNSYRIGNSLRTDTEGRLLDQCRFSHHIR